MWQARYVEFVDVTGQTVTLEKRQDDMDVLAASASSEGVTVDFLCAQFPCVLDFSPAACAAVAPDMQAMAIGMDDVEWREPYRG